MPDYFELNLFSSDLNAVLIVEPYQMYGNHDFFFMEILINYGEQYIVKLSISPSIYLYLSQLSSSVSILCLRVWKFEMDTNWQ